MTTTPPQIREDGAVRVPAADDAVEPNSGLTGAELRALIRRREIRAFPVMIPGCPRGAVLVTWESLRQWILHQDRTESYRHPRGFGALLARYPITHRRDVAGSLVEVAGPFFPGEEDGVERVIAEQERAGRQVALAYSRKAVWVYREARA